MYQIYVYIPIKNKESVKQAMFKAGAGRLGEYDECCFEYQGMGQFRPLEGSDPHLGRKGRLELVQEVKVEMICDQSHLSGVIKAMREAHPYEEVAFGVLELVNPEFLSL
jgi:hypothetical protein